ncbi:MAG TPA: 50S ribosomal protein L31, partial [Armatimonadota bacterium]|nr:50S ribosomal protein L31 [Armatimonadota bacterium]
FTGQQKIIDTEGRVERFIRRYKLQDRYGDPDQGKQQAGANKEG